MSHETAARWFWRCCSAVAILAIAQAFVEWSWSPLIPFDGGDVAHTKQGIILSAVSLFPLLGALVFGLAWVLLASSALDRRRT